MPDRVRETLQWIERNTRSVSGLMEPEVLLPILNALARKVDGTQPTPKIDHEVDPRAAVNPVQARTLLRTVVGIKRSGPHLAACYACS